MIGKLSELLVSGHHRTGFADVTMSPRSPLDLKTQSPRGLRNYDFGAVGLGIVAALEKSGDHNNNTNNNNNNNCNYNPFLAKQAIVSTSSHRTSAPIPVSSAVDGGDAFDSDEDYTFVACHGPNDKSFTKVYYDVGGDYRLCRHHQIGRALRRPKNDKGIFDIAAAVTPSPSFTSDFLSCCHLCNKKLHGKDIFMYRGEKAFCSSECRSSQILMDERKEQCRSEAPRSVVDHASSSPYSRGQIFSTGIFAI